MSHKHNSCKIPVLVIIAFSILLLAGTGCGNDDRPPLQAYAVTWGGPNEDEITGVAVDSERDHRFATDPSHSIPDLFHRGRGRQDSTVSIYCAGCTHSFGAGYSDALLLKYSSSGTLQWAKTWGGNDMEYISGVAVDSIGNIYSAGITESFGSGGLDVLLLKYNSSGTLQWAKTWGGTGWDEIYQVAVDSNDNIYCAGCTQSFGVGGFEALLLKYDTSGALQWAKTIEGTDSNILHGVAVDSSDSIICAGFNYNYTTSQDALILKFNPSGTLQWAKTWDYNEWDDNIWGIAVDSACNIYCAGETYDNIEGRRYSLLLKYDSSGKLQWARTWSNSGWDFLMGVVVDSGGNIYCAGVTTIYYDALLLKYDSSGTLQWARAWCGSGRDGLVGIALDSRGNIYLGGSTFSYTGAWQTITTGIEGTLVGTEGSPSESEGSPTGTESSPLGIESSPVGSETGAGRSDTLLLKNWE